MPLLEQPQPPLPAPVGNHAAETLAALKGAARADIIAMLRFAWSRGIDLPAEVRERLETLDETEGRPAVPLPVLAEVHATLSRAVSPAMPITLRLMDRHLGRSGWHAVMGPIGNVRRLLIAALAFLILFMGISMCPILNAATMDGDLYNLEGARQLVVMLFLLSAAGIGATFQALFTAQRYVANATYDPHHDGSYWILIALGLVAGLLLAVLIPVNMEGAESPTLAKPVLALLGGFSSGLVYRILQRLVDTIEALFQPRPPST